MKKTRLASISNLCFLVAIGDTNKRAKVIERLISLNAGAAFIAEKSYVAESAKVGVGTLISESLRSRSSLSRSWSFG